MAEPFLAELRVFSFNFAPKGWATCNGQLLPINQNQALFSLLGTTYGGNGQTNFALPDLRGRVPMHAGAGYARGERPGAGSVTLTQAQMPAHGHVLNATTASADRSTPADGLFAPNPDRYGTTGTLTTLSPASVTSAGGSQPHTNVQPSLALTLCIALQGIFPSQN